MELSTEQQLAAYTTDSKVIVAANSGAGKTATLTARVKYLLDSNIDPNTIFCITYTNMAAQEMQSRLGEKTCFIGTIHSLANRILNMNGISTDEFIQDENFDELFAQYSKYNNLIIPTVNHLLVDEFQDICDLEYDFMMNILKPHNYWFCGDSAQSIFGFKGSNYHFFMDLTEDPFTSVYELRANYRSAPEIVDFANSQLKKVTDIYRIPTRCMRNYGNGIVEEEEFSFARLAEVINSMDNYGDWFVLARTNQEVADIIYYLNSKNIPTATFKKAEKSFAELTEELKTNTVKVLTIHSAKGLEAKNVIVVGAKIFNNEEKRICYVAATRAKDYLLWMSAKKKPKNKKFIPQYKMEEW